VWTSASRDERFVEILKAVAHPLRMRILSLLCEGEETVGGIAERLGARQPIVSQALALLRRERLVAATRLHGFATYRLEEGALRELIPCIERTLLPRTPARRGQVVARPLRAHGGTRVSARPAAAGA
jgi:ArsR family transcriptional regulator